MFSSLLSLGKYVSNVLMLGVVFPWISIEKYPSFCVCGHVCMFATSNISFKEDILPSHLFHLIKPLEKIRGVFSSGEISLTGSGF